ncbi:hypothetical protein V8C44DRAFT_236232 [Trichoderma aethiopicum]
MGSRRPRPKEEASILLSFKRNSSSPLLQSFRMGTVLHFSDCSLFSCLCAFDEFPSSSRTTRVLMSGLAWRSNPRQGLYPVAKVELTSKYDTVERKRSPYRWRRGKRFSKIRWASEQKDRRREVPLQKGLSAVVHRSAKILPVERLCAGPGTFRPARASLI